MKEVFGNKVKDTREKVVSVKERNTGISGNISCVNTVMDGNEKSSSEICKL